MLIKIWFIIKRFLIKIVKLFCNKFRISFTQKDEVELIRILKFGVIGVSNTIISYAVYSILVLFGVYYIIGSMVGFFISIINAYYWNSKFVFYNRVSLVKEHVIAFIRMVVSYSFTGIILQNIILFLLVEAGISQYIAPLFILIITIPLNYILNKIWVFKIFR